MQSLLKILLISALAVFLASCGVTRKGTDPEKKPPPAPRVEVSDADELPMVEHGVASWYGPNFDGKLTANGEIYDMNGVTAAHRTIPFGTILLVENIDNGKSVQVRVNDRGPYAKDRIIDLSKGAAEAIEMIGPGTANVQLYLVEGDLENSRITDIKVPTYTVQLGSYQEKSQAEKRQKQINGSWIEPVSSNNKIMYRLYYGNFTDPDEAREEMRRLRRSGHDGFVKQIENN
ncbi:septal ring lytic transglycosylase RlpA family protein [Gracilimonas mengyeensis]|uniref:Probable endolytic peptidoglycan transglycosylase RlpA n=1 Tax=Gracilimonas mengyeensis TaxID=1302730 RepID=A0A521B6N5_9BACT|nr:septal ring lytic transglycosylase RlpA family protein [Gracilimonas mengyeensis]SMO42764.1 rare lipoprotein A [Gracilimonas mengyeensis]